MKTSAFLGALGALILAAGSANAAEVTFAGDLDPGREVTPPDLGGIDPADIDNNSGVFFQYDDATKILCGRVEYANLTGPATGIHVHQAPKGQPDADGAATAKIIIPVAASGLTFKVKLDASWETSLMVGEIYTNLHTDKNTKGEARARMDPFDNSGGDIDPIDCTTATLVQLPGAATPDAGADGGGSSTSSSSSSSTSSSSGSSGSTSSSSGNGDNGTTTSSSGAPKAPIQPNDDPAPPAKSGCSSTASEPANLISMSVLGAFAFLGIAARRRNKKTKR